MVSVNLILRENLIGKAQYSASEYEKGAQKEAESLNTFESQIDKIMNDIKQDNSLAEQYLKIINIANGLVNVSEEEIMSAARELDELGAIALVDETEFCINVNKYYYYYEDDNSIFVLLNEDSEEYKKFKGIVDELLDLEVSLNNLLVGYTFTEENWSKDEFKTYIETNLERTVEKVNDKEMSIIIYFKSSIGENVEITYETVTTMQGSTYTIEKVEFPRGAGGT